MATEPFLKWPGGKRWLTGRYPQFFSETFERYVEPFLGGGAVFFHLEPQDALLSDSNRELINAYRCVRSHPLAIERRLLRLHARHNAKLYYRTREAQPRTALDRAVRFLYLNRTCFNGLYRVNRAGQFNVPMGSKTEVAYSPGLLSQAASALKGASLKSADFETVINTTGKGDLLYLDPPYTVMHNNNNFIKYNAHLFSWADQERLANAVRRAAARGAHIILSNADHSSVRGLYKGFGKHLKLERPTILAAGASHRCATTELLVTTLA